LLPIPPPTKHGAGRESSIFDSRYGVRTAGSGAAPRAPQRMD
jgi:hypothetical protein